ncbi:MAG TPA: cation-translocating P-type ATPase [Paludibacteraceae bacterium]|nr:cation-translocating P-type ATPase [Bacteroidales bacterium]HOH55609.1 cation-translocating P-type ATPase [Paludibacteraceae bacterium]
MIAENWHSKAYDEILQMFGVNPEIGLNEEEVKNRQQKYGQNRLQAQKKKSVLELFVAQLKDWLIYVLFAAVVITLFMGEYIDAVIILAVIILNAVLGVIQEVRAGNAIEALQKMTHHKALVRRNGQIIEVDSEELVPGDIVILDAGRFIPADLRLIETANLQVEESALTGESVPSEKDASFILDASIPIGDRKNLAFMSSLVTYGRGVGVVVATGMNTEVGKIAGIINNEQQEKTPLEIRLNQLGKALGKLAIGICIFIFLIGILQGRDWIEMFLISVSLAVASIPEGLAAIVAVVLSIGVTAMSKRNAIIRRLPAVETLGSVNVICTDKTGTLTQNKMTVLKTFTFDEEKDILRKQPNNVGKSTQFLAKAMILCSDASWDGEKGTGDPTEIALLMLGDDVGLDRKKLAAESHRVAEYAFDSERKLMSTLIEENGTLTVYTKGAIDNLLKISTRVLVDGKIVPLTEEYRNSINQAVDFMSEMALRTLGAAFKPVNEIIESSEMEKDLILIGVVGMMDPPRPEVRDAIRKAKEAGITTVMITGDHKKTAFAIAKELHIADSESQVLTGQELDEMTDEQLNNLIMNLRVFARVSPEHKVRIVRAYKANGNIVSMTGDGVNDAPSLNAADIGVAMGISGTDVAKDSSDMILVDDNFSTIVSAIEQGRNIYANIKKSVLFLLTCNLGEVLTMFIALISGMASPFLATQLLWINLLTDSLPALALGMDPSDPDVMKEKPRDPKESFFSHGAGVRSLVGGLLIGLVTLLSFVFGYWEKGFSPFDRSAPDEVVQYARTLAFITIISCQLFYSFNYRNEKKSIFSVGIFSNKYLLGAIFGGLALQLLVVLITPVRQAFKLQLIDLQAWIVVIVSGLLPLICTEIYKFVANRKANSQNTH